MSSKSDMYDKYGDIIPDGYNSPIELIAGNLQTQIENDAVKVVQSYGFNVDKAELEKALKYDRGQYDKGYAAGRKNVPRWIPIGERLPDLLDYVLVSIQFENEKPIVRSGYYEHGEFHLDHGYDLKWNDPEVKAWMPLPLPYEQEAEDVFRS